MSADRNEALRLADAARIAELEQALDRLQGNYLIAFERGRIAGIAEMESRVHTCGPACSKAGCINRRLTEERDQLRAEVERLRADAERWHVANLTAETAWKHPDHRSQEENTAFSAYRCAVEDGLNFEGAVDAAVDAIAARTTHKDEG